MNEKKLTLTCTCGKTIQTKPNLHEITSAIVNHAKTHTPQEINKTIYQLTTQILTTIPTIP